MSNWREQFEDESVVAGVSTLFARYYHFVAVALLVAFAFWNRTRNWGNYVVDGEILFRGNDPWYHYRMTQYVVENFPGTMPFDPWTRFPVGTANAQFGTIYDQVVATAALVVGLGSPSEELVKLVALFAPAVVGVAIAVPTYVICRRLGGRFAGVVGVAIFALASDRLLSLSVAGFFDHHVAEALTQALAVLAVMVAIRVAEEDKPVYELLVDREWGVLRRSLGWGVVAGVAIGVYLWVWPPGVLLLGILGAFFLVHLSLEYLRGRSPEHAAIVGAVALATTGVTQLAAVRVVEITATARSLLQPGLAFAVAFGCVFMAWLARQWDGRDISPLGYPTAVAGVLLGGTLFAAVVLPDLFDFFVNNTLRVVGLQTSPTAGTVGEAQPGSLRSLFGDYAFALVLAATGALVLLVKQYLDDDPRGEHVLVVVWFAFILAASLTQARFGYYLTVPVAALNAALIGVVMKRVGRLDESLEVETYQVLTVVAILLVVVAPMLAFSSPVAAGGGAQNPGGVVGWDSSLDWLSENTPVEGQLGNPDGEPMNYYGTFGRTDDYDYEDGAFGVMSWWDYGHWITVHGERIPNANPFQQGASDAAEYLLTQTENASLAFLDAHDEEDAETRYVMVDWKMAQTESRFPVRGKFFAPPTFDDDSNRSTYFTRILDTDRLQETNSVYASTLAMRHKQPYYETTLARLYLYHGSAQEPRPYVLDWQGAERQLIEGEQATFVNAPEQGTALKVFPNMSAAREYVDEDGTAQIGGFGPYPRERVPAMDQYRLVHMSEFTGLQGQLGSAFQRDLQLSGLGQQLQRQLGADANQSAVQRQAINFLYPNTPSWTKTFEQVPGATIQGTGPENTTLRMRVQMVPENGAPFLYRKQVTTDEDGEFVTTVPYSTTGYDELGPEEGYTNTSVRAAGPYAITSGIRANETGSLRRWTATVDVSEAKVVGADDSPVTVELQHQVVGQAGDGSDSNGTATDEPQDDGQGTDSGSEDGGSSDGASGTTGTESLGGVSTGTVAPPATRP